MHILDVQKENMNFIYLKLMKQKGINESVTGKHNNGIVLERKF